jgi:hypothetical protein
MARKDQRTDEEEERKQERVKIVLQVFDILTRTLDLVFRR